MTNPHLRDLLSRAFGEPIHIPPEDFLGKVIAGCFCRQPCMSGDQRDRLNSKERRAVDDAARSIAEALTTLTAEVGQRDEALRWVFKNGLPHDTKRPDFVNQAFSDAYAEIRRARTLIEEKPE